MKKVLLVSAPFGALNRPALGLSLLKPALARAGIACDVRYLAFTFAELIGRDEYEWISGSLPYTAFAGDWTFTPHLYGDRPDADRRYVQEILRDTWHLDDDTIARIGRVRPFTRTFLDYCIAAIPWRDYAVVGFTSTFEQNIASLALAWRLKAAHPHLAIVFGGANWEGEMGLELHRQFPFVDYVCSGEADRSFPALAALLTQGDAAVSQQSLVHPYTPPAQGVAAALAEAIAGVRGVVYRGQDGVSSLATGAPELIRDLDQLPMPDFSDYFRGLDESALGAEVVPTLLLESSRGCWWGAKSHCTFCGLNGQSMTFRSKSAARTLAEMTWLADTWKTDLIEAVDNILDMRYFNEVLPTLARAVDAGRRWQIFYEVKANLSRAQVQLLHDAGVNRIQPGIESLSDHVLKLMRKGTTGLRNIQLLKWCKEWHVHVDWNVLHGFPGETRADYDAMLAMLPAIRFLGMPTAWGPVRLDRFSPYHHEPETFGMINVRPMAAYRHLYPFDEASVARIAYYFDYDYAPEVDPTGHATDVTRYLAQWREQPETGSLVSIRREDGALAIVDTRSDAKIGGVVLSGLEQTAYAYCDELRPWQAVVRHLREMHPDDAFDEENVRRFLDSLVAAWWMVTDGEHYLSLAVRAPSVVAQAHAA